MAQPAVTVSEFRVGSVLGRGFSILFNNIVPFLFLTVLIYSPLIIYTAMIDTSETMEESLAIWEGVVIFGSILLTMILTATLIYGTVQELRGQHATIGDCLSRGLSRTIPVLGVAILSMAAMTAGFIALIIPGYIVMTMLWVAIPVAVVERPGVINSLRRSSQLTKGDRWRIFGIILILGIIEGVPSQIIENMNIDDVKVALMLSLAVTAFVGAVDAVVTAVGYHDLRVTKEGVGIEEIAAVFD